MSRTLTIAAMSAAIALAVAAWQIGPAPAPRPGPGPAPVVEPDVEPTPQVTSVVYLHKKSTRIPPAVKGAINEINRGGEIRASLHLYSTTDGDGEVPDQFKPAVEAVSEHELPTLVILAGDEVVDRIADPRTKDDVLEALP